MRIATWCLAAVAGTAAADVIPVIGAQESVSIPMPAGADGVSLLLELDGYDVAAISTVADGRIAIPLSGLSLTPGEHYLLIQAARDNGDVDLLAEHTLDVFAREGVRSSASKVGVLLGSDHRLAGHPDEIYQDTSRSHHNGTLQWTGEVDRSSWVASGALDLLFDSDRSVSFDGQRWQLPTLNLSAGRRFEHGGVGLGFGDTEVESNLIFGGFNRRGLRLEADALDGRFAARAFTLHAEPVTGIDADLPPFDDSSSVVGAFTSIAPFASHPDALRLSASWLDGDSTLGGAGVFVADDGLGLPLQVGGDAYTLAVDSLPLERALWIHGEYARANFDADGIHLGAPEREADARRFVAQLSSGGALDVPALEQWSLGFEHQRVGAGFYSLGNLMLPNDLDYRQLHAAATWKGLGLRAQWLDQNTDVEDELLTPRIDSRQRQVSLEFTPEIADPTIGAWKWLGTPTFRLSRETTDNEMRAADATLAAFDLDNYQRSTSAGIDFAHEKFTLGFSFDQVRRDDRSQALVVDDFVVYEPTPDSTEKLFGVSVSWFVNERLSFVPQWQRSRTRESGAGSSDNDLWSLQVQAELIPDELSAQLGWSETSDRQRLFELPQDAQRLSSSTGNLDLSYRMKLFTFHLRGAYGRNALRTALLQQSDSQWQALFAVELNWEHSR